MSENIIKVVPQGAPVTLSDIESAHIRVREICEPRPDGTWADGVLVTAEPNEAVVTPLPDWRTE